MADSLLADYQPLDGSFDEVVQPDGEIRPHWKRFVEQLFANGLQTVSQLWEAGQRLIHENGTTFLAIDESGRRQRPWQLDAIPLLLPAQEWTSLTDALAQRAALLNAILQDVYGSQELIRKRLLPAEFAFANPRFLRPLHHLRVPENRYLHHYAADLARAPDGKWWVLGDRTSSPAGSGYALENRIVTSRMMPELFRKSRVERLAPYYKALQESLKQSAQQARENPHVVLLTRGSASAEYFEDAYLSRYLGYTLVEAGDLAVRDNRVMLKTLGALVPIDVILRRPLDEECDPVELKGDSLFGVAGLLEVIRAGNVSIANALGSGIVESPMLIPFLPALARHLLGEDLRIPTVATWWCGTPKARSHVLANLDSLVIRSAFHRGREHTIDPSKMNEEEKTQLAAAIEHHPEAYVGQETVRRSTAPVWEADGLKPWHVALRSFLVAKSDGAYSALPGGLVRMSASSQQLDHSMSSGDRSQDAWILADRPVTHFSLLSPPDETIRPRRGGSELPSRVAENLFWFGRYVERIDGTVRLLRSIFSRLTSETDYSDIPEMPMLLRCLAALGQIEPGFVLEGISDQLPLIDHALPDAIFNEDEDRSLISSVLHMRRMASLVRDRISLDLWRIVNRIEQSIEYGQRTRTSGDVFAMLNQLVLGLSAFGGLVADSMTRSLGWRFLEIGRIIERVLHVAVLVRSAIVDQETPVIPLLEAALEVGDSLMTYRSRYLASLHPAPVIDLLLLDETSPRSIAFQLADLNDHVARLPRDPGDPTRAPYERIAMTQLHSIRMADVEQLAHTKSGKQQLDRLLTRLTEQLPKLGEEISHRYLIHAGAPRQFVPSQPEGGR